MYSLDPIRLCSKQQYGRNEVQNACNYGRHSSLADGPGAGAGTGASDDESFMSA